jgi:hypothetical protein
MLPIFYGTFFTITGNDVTIALGYTSDLVGDFMPLLLPLIGIGSALAIYRHFKK